MKFRFIQLGNKNNILVNKLVESLKSIQNEFEFIYADREEIQIKEDVFFTMGFVNEPIIVDAVQEYFKKKIYREIPIVITDYPLEDYLLFSSEKDNNAIISTYDFSSFSKFPPVKVLLYALVLILLELFVDTPVHDDIRGCPNDYCNNREDNNIGMAKGEFCEECNKTILSALELNKITVNQIAAIKRILDKVASRKICFVLMPFSSEFNCVYDKIKKIVSEKNYECLRADEIKEPRNIMNIISEMIWRADSIIADITGKNANVFYELGYSHAIGKNTILIAQCPEDVPFDISQRQYVIYNTEDIDSTLISRISHYLK